jgi:hypothetical protein
MDLTNTNRGVVRFVDGNTITIAHRRGGTSKARVDRKFTVGDIVCFIVEPIHLSIISVMLKSEADNMIKKSGSEEHQVASISSDGMPLEDPDFLDADPVEQFYGKEPEDDINDIINPGQVSQKFANLDNGEDRTDVVREADYFEE